MMGAVSVDRVEAAYRRVHARLWRSLMAYGGDAEVASDAEAEAFAQALRRGDAIDDVDAWVWRTAFRIAAGMLSDRRAGVPLSDAPPAGVTVPAPVVELLDLLGCLTEQQRACVVLRYLGGFESPRIADLLGTSPGTVRVQLHRAHQTLREMLQTEMQEGT
jgi:RNA polymerase sigma-70 factor (ECF subfamily)